MQFKNRQFEKDFCGIFDCGKLELMEKLRRVEQIEVVGSFNGDKITLYIRENNMLRTLKTRYPASEFIANLGAFEFLSTISIKDLRGVRKLFVHNFPVGIEGIVWDCDINPPDELFSNLTRFEMLHSLTLNDASGLPHYISSGVKSSLNYLDAAKLDVRKLDGFRNLKELRLSRPGHFDEMPSLETVTRFTGCALHGIDGIQALPNLERLTAQNCNISSVEPLSGLANLRKADLSKNYIHDINPLACLHGMETLDISDNLIEDISPLAGRYLSSLDLSHNPVEDISVLEGCGKLEYLDLRDTYVRDISMLSGCSGLRELYVDAGNLKDRKQLAKLSHVESINGMDFGECLWFYKVNSNG